MSQERHEGFLSRFIETVAYGFTVVAAVGLAIMMLDISLNVVLRNVFATGIRGADELDIYLLVLAGFGAIPYALFQNRHISVDVLLERLSSRGRYWLTVTALPLAIACIGIITYGLVLQGIQSTVEQERWVRNVIVPIWPARIIIGISFVVFVLSYFAVLGRHIARRGPSATPLPSAVDVT